MDKKLEFLTREERVLWSECVVAQIRHTGFPQIEATDIIVLKYRERCTPGDPSVRTPRTRSSPRLIKGPSQ